MFNGQELPGCPGYIIDQITALKGGGADVPFRRTGVASLELVLGLLATANSSVLVTLGGGRVGLVMMARGGRSRRRVISRDGVELWPPPLASAGGAHAKSSAANGAGGLPLAFS